MISLAPRHRAMRAAVLGGIVRCIIASGRCDIDHVARYARDIICACNLVGVDRSRPCPAEVGMVLERFEETYADRSPVDRMR